MHQIKKKLSHPNLHLGDVFHCQSNPPVTIAHSFSKSSPTPAFVGSEYADALARKSITACSDVADTSIKTAGSEGNPFYNIY
jgi:hypothetical protein